MKNWNPSNDVEWLNRELTLWLYKIIFKDWGRIVKKLESDRSKLPFVILDRLSGLGASLPLIRDALRKFPYAESVFPGKWDEQQKLTLADYIRSLLFPACIVANKIDKPNGSKYLKEMREKYPSKKIVPTSGLAELALIHAAEKGIINYIPGSGSFDIIVSSAKEIEMLKTIDQKILKVYGSTGIYHALEILIFDILCFIPVFPVEDIHHYTDATGRILPDVFLIPKGTSVREFAGKIHSDFEKHFLHGVLAKNGRRVSATHEVEFGDVIKIVSAAK